MQKPEKPYKEFPLFAHSCGQWAKKINQKLWYFGTWADPDAAIEKCKREVDDIRAGRDPRRMQLSQGDGDCSLIDLGNSFLTSQDNAVKAGRLSRRMFDQYRDACRWMVDHFGRNVLVRGLRTRDFSSLIAAFFDSRGAAVGLGQDD